jgi:hypothetical protein
MTKTGVPLRSGIQIKETGGIGIVLAGFAQPALGARRAIGFTVRIRDPCSYGRRCQHLAIRMTPVGNMAYAAK